MMMTLAHVAELQLVCPTAEWTTEMRAKYGMSLMEAWSST